MEAGEFKVRVGASSRDIRARASVHVELADRITPVPKPKKRRAGRGQSQMIFDGGDGLSSEAQEYNPTPIINEVR